ncbi:VWA domain-containing protein [Tautonia sp. JC769]|uniref:VWA domain-containing protein n=1 Tax=Tautonia sp. JC769 TaxID=3232135 RepID=UPI0034583D8E
MDFAQPQWLWCLMALPIVGGASWIAARRRRSGWSLLAQSGRPPGDGGGAWSLAIALSVVALAQPRWGRAPAEPLPPGRDVILAIDVSWSMAAEDVVPNRLGNAVQIAGELTQAIGREPGDRVGVVAFSGRGVIRCPLTANLGAVVEVLRALRPGAVEPTGSDLGAGLETALDAFDDQPRDGGRVVIMISDGEDHEKHWERLVERARTLGVVVHTLALGDRDQGHPIPVGPARGPDRPRFLFRGEPVETRRVDLELRGVALATGGAFLPIGLASADLGDLYERHIVPVQQQARDAFRRPERPERFRLFLAVGLAIGLVGAWPWPRPIPRRKPWWTSWMVVIGLTAVSLGMVQPGSEDPRSAAEAIASGRSAFDRGDYAAALDAFGRAEGLDPESAIPVYNAAATLYQLGRFEEARDRYRAARGRADEGLTLKIDYALGNCSLALGAFEAAIGHYDDCLESTAAGEHYDVVRSFAQENRSFAIRRSEADAVPAEGDDPGGAAETPGEPDGERSSDDPDEPPGENDRDGSDSPNAGSAGLDPEDAPAPTGTTAAAGTGTASGRPSRQPDSPADRLARALDSIRAARDRRFPDLPREPASRRNEPNW